MALYTQYKVGGGGLGGGGLPQPTTQQELISIDVGLILVNYSFLFWRMQGCQSLMKCKSFQKLSKIYYESITTFSSITLGNI